MHCRYASYKSFLTPIAIVRNATANHLITGNFSYIRFKVDPFVDAIS